MRGYPSIPQPTVCGVGLQEIPEPCPGVVPADTPLLSPEHLIEVVLSVFLAAGPHAVERDVSYTVGVARTHQLEVVCHGARQEPVIPLFYNRLALPLFRAAA